jgi:hypothetical protein|tara:strand:+ start:108 stop:584 length:477 start_codon:yes stop_codon:yes gene_type:complete
MKFGNIKNLIGGLAPTVASALGGPLAGAAAQSIATALGVAPEPKALEKAIQNATPEQLAEIKKAELDFEVRMKELDVDIFDLETKDIQDARKNFAKDWTSKLIAIVMVFFFCGYIAMITLMPPEQNSMELINLVLGYMGGLVSAVISFYFGASQGQDK